MKEEEEGHWKKEPQEEWRQGRKLEGGRGGMERERVELEKNQRPTKG